MANMPSASKEENKMTLKRVKMEPDYYPDKTGKHKLDAFPTELQPITASLPVINITASRGYMYPLPLAHYMPDQTGWTLQQPEEQYLKQSDEVTMSGEHFVEEEQGLMAVSEAKDSKELLLSGRLKLIKIVEIWYDELHSDEELVCQITFPPAWQMNPKEVRTAKTSYKELPAIIRKKIPEAIVSSSSKVAWDEYLSAIYRRDEKQAEHEIISQKTGWLNVRGETRYRLGRDRFYAEYHLPDVSSLDRRQIFFDGWRFMNVGHNNAAISILWLWAHMAFTVYWFQRIGIRFQTVLYMQGASGNLKTATTSVVSNVFDTNRRRATIRMTSTFPSIQESIVMSPDTLSCLDDFSNSETTERDRATENAEKVVRAVGDGIFPEKMGGYNYNEVRRDHVRCAIVLTGEESLSLGRSSNLRSLVVPIFEGTFDGRELEPFQQDPNIMRRYFMLFVSFLEENGPSIFTSELIEEFGRYRGMYSKRLEIKRFVDTAAQLSILIDMLQRFACWCGLACELDDSMFKNMRHAIDDLMHSNQQSSQTLAPEVRFVYALAQSFGTGRSSMLAPDEETYAKNEAGYLGFKDESSRQIWLRFEDAWKLVASFYQKLGEPWLTKPQTIKVALLEAGLSDGRRMPRGTAGNEYLRKARKGSRKRMLVLNMDKVDQVINDMVMKGELK